MIPFKISRHCNTQKCQYELFTLWIFYGVMDDQLIYVCTNCFELTPGYEETARKIYEEFIKTLPVMMEIERNV